MDGFQEEIRPWASIVKTPSAMELMIMLKKRAFQISWVLSGIVSFSRGCDMRYMTVTYRYHAFTETLPVLSRE
jgi:hypothetical protein